MQKKSWKSNQHFILDCIPLTNCLFIRHRWLAFLIQGSKNLSSPRDENENFVERENSEIFFAYISEHYTSVRKKTIWSLLVIFRDILVNFLQEFSKKSTISQQKKIANLFFHFFQNISIFLDKKTNLETFDEKTKFLKNFWVFFSFS